MTGREPRVLLGEEAIARRVGELAAEISRDYAGKGELLLVGVLKGAFIFLADLARRLTIPRAVEFIALSKYGTGSERSGEVRLVMDLRTGIAGRHVLVVEDIVDTGHTLDHLLRLLAARNPASLEACALVRKPDRVERPVRLAYLGFDIPDRWVVGYGLDLAERDRTLPYIAWVEDGQARRAARPRARRQAPRRPPRSAPAITGAAGRASRRGSTARPRTSRAAPQADSEKGG